MEEVWLGGFSNCRLIQSVHALVNVPDCFKLGGVSSDSRKLVVSHAHALILIIARPKCFMPRLDKFRTNDITQSQHFLPCISSLHFWIVSTKIKALLGLSQCFRLNFWMAFCRYLREDNVWKVYFVFGRAINSVSEFLGVVQDSESVEGPLQVVENRLVRELCHCKVLLRSHPHGRVFFWDRGWSQNPSKRSRLPQFWSEVLKLRPWTFSKVDGSSEFIYSFLVLVDDFGRS